MGMLLAKIKKLKLFRLYKMEDFNFWRKNVLKTFEAQIRTEKKQFILCDV